MKIEVFVKKEVNIKIVEIDIAVRYDEEDIPNNFPFRKGDLWSAKIEVDTGKIIDWPIGKNGDMFMKVCDEGTYRLIDEKGELVAEIENDYVPNGLIPPTDGHGDYVHLIIDKDGYVTNWYQKPSFEDFFPDND